MDHPTYNVTRALLIGISRYAPSATGVTCNLNGPGSDVALMRRAIAQGEVAKATLAGDLNSELLRQATSKAWRGQAGVSVDILADEQATARQVIESVRELCRTIAPGDTGIFYRSGHGSYVSGTEEADGTDEVFCPHDFLLGKAVFDDELAALVTEALQPGAQLLVFADTCHSGDSMRSSLTRKRGTTAPANIAYERRVPKSRTFVNTDRMPAGVTLYAACAPDEVAWERPVNGQVLGAFTSRLPGLITQIVSGVGIDWDAWHTRISRALDTKKNKQGGQRPQLERER